MKEHKKAMLVNRVLHLALLLLVFTVARSWGPLTTFQTRSGCRAARVSSLKTKLKMVSVGGGVGGGTTGSGDKKSRVLIAPDTDSDEMMIIENFGQIQSGERKRIGIIGTQDLSDAHYQMIELLTYALVLSGNHIFTSGSAGNIENSLKTTNTAVIYGALRACSSELLTVILPQSLPRQPAEMQTVLMRVANLIEHPENDDLDFKEAVSLCNDNVLSCVDKLLIFAYHDSKYVLQCADKVQGKMEITKFFLD